MTNNYSQEELDQILLGKNVNDFYIAIVENRKGKLSDEEYEEIKSIENENKDIVELREKLESNKTAKKYSDEIMKIIYDFSQIRKLTILTMVGEDVYDIGSAEFEDLAAKKIICFDKLSTLFSEDEVKVKYFTPEEEPGLKQKTVLIDVEDEDRIFNYEKEHVNQEESNDLTEEFFKAVKEQTKALKKSN